MNVGQGKRISLLKTWDDWGVNAIAKVPASWHEDWSLHPKHPCKKLGNLVPSCDPSAGGMRWGKEKGGSLDVIGFPAVLVVFLLL